ncbi:MAG: hypothetical protein IJX46_07720 [Clostridia bacterium]|nr:hypothetical protein [Clostridia bacterium]
MKYVHLNYDDPLMDVISDALAVIKNLNSPDLSPRELAVIRRNATSVLSKLEARSDKITLSNLTTMFHAVVNVSLFFTHRPELYHEVFVEPELSLPLYMKSLEASAKALEAWASELGFGLLSL